MRVGQNHLRVSILATRNSMLMLTLIKMAIAIVAVHLVAKASMVIVRVGDTEVKVAEDMDLLVGAVATE